MASTHLRRLLCILLACTSLLATAGTQYRVLDWLDLLDDHDREATLNLPELNHDSEDGFIADKAWQEVLSSTRVRPELDRQQVELAGFVVPIDTNAEGDVTEMFLVPYFGACIHVPPPPANQIIHIRYPKGLALDALTTPFRVLGTLRVETISNDMASASYAMQADQILVYEF